MSTKPEPRPRPQTTPEVQPPPGTPPKRFPEHPTPLSGDQLDPAAKSAAERPDGPAGDSGRVGGGEDPDVESGANKNDPEQPTANDDAVEKSFE
jgi:hypothetical protein